MELKDKTEHEISTLAKTISEQDGAFTELNRQKLQIQELIKEKYILQGELKGWQKSADSGLS